MEDNYTMTTKQILLRHDSFTTLVEVLQNCSDIHSGGYCDEATQERYNSLAELPATSLLYAFRDAREVFKRQEFRVKLSVGASVKLEVTVYFENKTRMFDDEIIEEAVKKLSILDSRIINAEWADKFLVEIEVMELVQ